MKVEAPKKDQKKTLVFVALFLVLGAVGAFQFMPGKEEPVASTKKPFKPVDGAAAVPDAPKNPEVAYDLSPRDPFETPPEPANPKAKPYVEPVKQPKKLEGDLALPPGTKNGDQAKINQGEAPTKGNTNIVPFVPPPPKFEYTLDGVLVGEKPIAVFRDAQGHERMIRMGGFIDGDAQVIWIDKAGVTVKFRGKELHLVIGGHTVAK